MERDIRAYEPVASHRVSLEIERLFKRVLCRFVGEDRQAVYRIRNALERQYLSKLKEVEDCKSDVESLIRSIRQIQLLKVDPCSLPGIGVTWAERWVGVVARIKRGDKVRWQEMRSRGADRR